MGEPEWEAFISALTEQLPVNVEVEDRRRSDSSRMDPSRIG